MNCPTACRLQEGCRATFRRLLPPFPFRFDFHFDFETASLTYFKQNTFQTQRRQRPRCGRAAHPSNISIACDSLEKAHTFSTFSDVSTFSSVFARLRTFLDVFDRFGGTITCDKPLKRPWMYDMEDANISLMYTSSRTWPLMYWKSMSAPASTPGTPSSTFLCLTS